MSSSMASEIYENKYDSVWLSLSEEQQNFIQERIRRGKRTAFARELARSKGIGVTDSMSDLELEQIIDSWEFIEYIDAGPEWRTADLRCKCGAQLRRRFTIRNKETDEIIHFGINHFEEHTGIPGSVVLAVLKGFNAIDFERDELLGKIQSGWKFERIFSTLPEGFVLPDDMREQLELSIPLLDKQIENLRLKIRRFNDEQFLQKKQVTASVAEQPMGEQSIEEQREMFSDQLGFDLGLDSTGEQQSLFFVTESPANGYQPLDVSLHEIFNPLDVNLPVAVKTAIDSILESGISSSKAICEMLIKKYGLPNERYLSETPRIYPRVCHYLDTLVARGKAACTTTADDRLYKLV